MTLQEQMDLLGWKDITTDRQIKNGTRIYKLPIKKYGQFIEVGSFESGYVRRMNGGYTPYQLNKCEPNIEFYKEYKWNDELSEQYWTGKYKRYVGKRRIKIMSTKKRLQYLITFCLKNYYINQANEVENGKFISKWKHEYEMKNGNIDKVRELQNEVMKYERTVRELHEEMDKLNENDEIECLNMEIDGLNSQLNNTNVVVNGEKYYRKR